MARAVTPLDLTITPRDRRFGRGLKQARWWMAALGLHGFYNACRALSEARPSSRECAQIPGVLHQLESEIRRSAPRVSTPRACSVQQKAWTRL